MTQSYFLKNNLIKFLILFFAAFLIRASAFYFYIQHNERYQHTDTTSYYVAALCINHGSGMHRPDNNQPIFWRTPGYPVFMSFFYKIFGVNGFEFKDNESVNKIIIWIQVFLCSLIPVLVLILSLILTGIFSISVIAAWIFVFHPGMIINSCYLQTDCFALLFLLPFFILFYMSFNYPGENKKNNQWIIKIIFSAIFLALFTWIRPMGEFIAIISAIILIFSVENWKKKISKILIFLLTFFALISPWYIRNYKLTDKWFFCPMFGPTLQCFSAPKIIRSLSGATLRECLNSVQSATYQKLIEEKKVNEKTILENVAFSIAWPIVKNYPSLFFKDWFQQIIKTTFDLHSHDLVDFEKGTYKFDPLEDFLTDRLEECLFNKKTTFKTKLISWIELFFMFFIWLGLFTGIIVFLVFPITSKNINPYIKQMISLWLKTGLMIGGILSMTGAFGYARLRLPVDPLLIILSLTFWYWLILKKVKVNNEEINHRIINNNAN